MKTNPLNPRQQTFADLVLAGAPAGRAWQQAGYQARGNSAEVQASKALKKEKFKAYLKDERMRMEKVGQMERDELVAWLASVIRTPAGNLTEDSPLVQQYIKEELAGEVIRTRVEMVSKLEACKLLAAVMGWNAPTKMEIQPSEKLAELIRRIRSKPVEH